MPKPNSDPAKGPYPARQWRPTPEDLAIIADLATRWGGIEPLTATSVLRESLRRAHAGEFGGEARPRRAARKTTN